MRSRQKEVMCVVCDGKFEKTEDGYVRIQEKPQIKPEPRIVEHKEEHKKRETLETRVPISREETRLRLLSNLEAKALLLSEEVAREGDLGRLR